MSLLASLRRFFSEVAPLAPGDRVVVAFSGGVDSTALLAGMLELARLAAPDVEIHAAHLDHGMDAGSARRAEDASRLAAALGAPLARERLPVPDLRRPGESLEAAGRRIRYAFLEARRRRLGARYVATAHHRDDQAETVLLRTLGGSGVAGLAGIRPVRGRIVRPLLDLPRAELAAAVAAAGLAPVEDPTNADLAVRRNRIRHRVLPALAADDPALAPRLARLAARARRAGDALERRLAELLPTTAGPDGGIGGIGGTAAVSRRDLLRLPEPLLPLALAALHRRAGAPYPASADARRELERQLRIGGRVGCDAGGGWRWERRREGRVELLALIRPRIPERIPGPEGREATAAGFTYTLEVPGEVEVPELSLRVRLSRGAVAPWMFAGAPERAGLWLPLGTGDRVTVRSRRPGDRLSPLGAPGSRRLKDVLIDRRVPRERRDRLPLLCVGDRIAWVPGVAIDRRFRLPRGNAGEVAPAALAADAAETFAWIAEVRTG